MKKLYALLQGSTLSFVLTSLLATGTASAQSSLCGGVQANFDNTSGSTVGFTGDFASGTTGSDGYLVKDRVIASAVYTITTPTYQSPAGSPFIGYGFELDGTEKVARVEVKIIYVSTFNNELTTVFLAQFVPSYDPNSSTASVCRAISIGDLPGFPSGGRYRFRIELTPNTGAGDNGQTVTFDDFATTGTLSQAPLPVNFIGFDAKRLNGNVQLTWQIAGEENVARYEVERSEDGRSFRTIGSIASHGKDTYYWNDAASNNAVYYRIKNVDNDGLYKYSTIARIANGRSEIVLKAFPLPVQSFLTLQHPVIETRARINVSNAAGQMIRSVVPAIGSMQTSVDMSTLQKGLYLIRFDAGDGEVKTLKVLKQ